MTTNNISLSTSSLKDSLAAIFSIKSQKEVDASSLSANKRVNEEELYSAINYGVLNSQDKELGNQYLSEVSKLVDGKNSKDYSFEEVNDSVLSKMKNAGKISYDFLVNLLSFSLGKSKLDSNVESLDTKKLDGAKTGDTPLRTLNNAISKYEENEAILENDAKRIKANLLSLSEEGTSNNIQDSQNVIQSDQVVYLSSLPEGFVYRPKGLVNKKLAIILPQEYEGRVKRVALYTQDNERIEGQANFEVNRNGKLVYRFEKNGKEYPENLQIHINLKGEKDERIVIKDPSKEIRG